MKTVIDAVNFYKAEWPKFDWDDFKEDYNCIVEALFTGVSDDLPYSAGEISQGGSKCDAEQFAIVCSEDEFNECVDKMSKAEWIKPKAEAKPIYTQAMADNSELPVKGMECLISLEGMPFTKGVIEYINANGFLFRYTDNGLNDFYDTDDRIVFKPLTPPIELIDGEAYQYEWRAADGCPTHIEKGLYSSGDGYFYAAKGATDHLICKNIKHLTV